ncbi:MAG: hypothetical protein R8M11_02355 [Gallionella sp.]
MDMEMAKFLFQVLTFLMTSAVAVYVYLANKGKVTTDRIEKMEDDIRNDIGKHGERITTLEAKSSEALTQGDLSAIHEKINIVAGSMRELKGEFSATNRTLQLIHETLMERK